MNLDEIIKVYDDYQKKNKKFKSYIDEVVLFTKTYPLNVVINFNQNEIYPITGKRDNSFLKKLSEEKLMGTTVGAIFSNYPKFFKKANSLIKFKEFLKDLTYLNKANFENDFNRYIIKKNHFFKLSTIKTVLIQILSLYFPKIFFPIYHLEGIEPAAKDLGIDLKDINLEKKDKLGESIIKLNQILYDLKINNSIMKNWTNVVFTHFLFTCFPLKRIDVIQKLGIKFFDPNEQIVVAIFSKIHKKLGFKCYTRIKTSFPDAEVEDNKGDIKQVEFEFNGSSFKSHENKCKKCDLLICWHNDLESEWITKKCPNLEIIELEDLENLNSKLYKQVFG